eukprot:GGOE01049904.1.p2 GENE.GGOE01049904.1~~GGOE01049904.1.p2  ORF type:complete len:214 (+),score=34.91 GGOE01049904.1:343-984(+)
MGTLHHGHRGRFHLAGCRVAELGAGSAIPSLVAFACGATAVSTDMVQAAQLLTLAKAAAAQEHPKDNPGRVFVRGLDWGASEAPHNEVLGCGCTEGRRLDPFDIVIAADCIYNPAAHGSLLRTVRSLLSRGGDGRPPGVAAVAFSFHGNVPDREVTAFFDEAEKCGFRVTRPTAPADAETSLPPTNAFANADPRRSVVHLYLLQHTVDRFLST